jgi:hypothetical protein
VSHINWQTCAAHLFVGSHNGNGSNGTVKTAR